MDVVLDEIRVALEAFDNSELANPVLAKLNDVQTLLDTTRAEQASSQAAVEELRALNASLVARVAVSQEAAQPSNTLDLEAITESLALRPTGPEQNTNG